jgi:hypothetical protein
MSAFDYKRTFRGAAMMSALRPKADVEDCSINVRL